MKKILLIFLFCILLMNIFACKNDAISNFARTTMSNTTNSDFIQVKIVKDNVVQVPTYGDINYDIVNDIDSSLFSKSLSTSAAKTIHTDEKYENLAAYSLDAKNSNMPIYIIETENANNDNINNKYKTVGLVYNYNLTGTYDTIKKNGVEKKVYEMLPFMCNCIINEKGLFVSVNLISSQMVKYNIKRSKGTNNSSDVTFNLYETARYLCDNAMDVKNALELVNYVNIKDIGADDKNYCGGSIFIVDSVGNYGVLELINDELVWNDMQNVSANFYTNKKYEKAVVGAGIGRVEYIKNNISNIKNEKDLKNLFRDVRYSNVYNYEKSKFDVRTEGSGTIGIDLINNYSDLLTNDDYKNIEEHVDDNGVHYVPYNVLNNDKFKTRLGKIYSEIGKIQKEKNENILSIFQVVANCNTKKMHIEFFENDKINLDLSVENNN